MKLVLKILLAFFYRLPVLGLSLGGLDPIID